MSASSSAATKPFQHHVHYLNIPAGDSFSFPLDERFQQILDFIYDALGHQVNTRSTKSTISLIWHI